MKKFMILTLCLITIFQMNILMENYFKKQSDCEFKEKIEYADESVENFIYLNNSYSTNIKKNEFNDETYRLIYQQMLARRERVNLKNNQFSIEQLELLCNQILIDHPEIFYKPTCYELIEESSSIYDVLKIEYYYTQEEVDLYNSNLEIVKKEFLSQIKDLDIIQQMKVAYEYAKKTVIEPFFNVSSKKVAYARTFQYFMKTAGFQCELIFSEDEQNAWNRLYYDKHYYYFNVALDIHNDVNVYFALDSEEMVRL